MPNRYLSERLNRELDAIGVPSMMQERVSAVAKIFKLPKFQAEALINGGFCKEDTINLVAEELEVSPHWLLGKATKKKLH
jgi:hypothetical protein